MAAFDLEEQEQISQIKGWWEEYGKVVTGAVLVAALASVGWQGWNWYTRQQSAEASALYTALQRAGAEHNAQKTREVAGMLIDKYASTAYADLAALLSAKIQVDAGDLKNARTQLAWLVEKGNDPTLRDLGRLRLAAILVDEKSYDEALAQLQGTPGEGLVARFAELKGDILASQGKLPEARAAYKAAVDALADAAKPESQALREIAQAKLDSLGAAQ